MVEAWELMTDDEREQGWNKFDSQFHFNPRLRSEPQAAIKEPIPSVTYYLKDLWGSVEPELHSLSLQAFRQSVPLEEKLIVLDWQHNCYWFYPHKLSKYDEWWEKWAIPVMPNGDYYIFLRQDLSFGVFGHPWEETLCVWGQPLLDAFGTNLDSLLGQVVRRDGEWTDEGYEALWGDYFRVIAADENE